MATTHRKTHARRPRFANGHWEVFVEDADNRNRHLLLADFPDHDTPSVNAYKSTSDGWVRFDTVPADAAYLWSLPLAYSEVACRVCQMELARMIAHDLPLPYGMRIGTLARELGNIEGRV